MTKRKTKTLVNFILDETGSMFPVKQQTIDGFNEYVDVLKSEKHILLKLTKFNSDKTRVYDTKHPKDYPRMDGTWYNPASTTPLYDAIGRSVRGIETDIAENGKDKFKVLCIIFTDGQENASREYSRSGILALIKEKEAQGWEFVYLGANQDSWLASEDIGISAANTRNYDPSNTKGVMHRIAGNTVSYSTGASKLFFTEKDEETIE